MFYYIEITYFTILDYDPGTNNQTLERVFLKSGEGKKTHHCQHVHQASPLHNPLGSSCGALLLAQHFIRQARTRCEAHLKVLIGYRLRMSAIFIYLGHLICAGVIWSPCSFICSPLSRCPFQVCYSVILPLPCPFFSLCMA